MSDHDAKIQKIVDEPRRAALRAARASYAAGLRDAAAALDYEVETYSRTVDGLSFPRLRAAILAAIPEEADRAMAGGETGERAGSE